MVIMKYMLVRATDCHLNRIDNIWAFLKHALRQFERPRKHIPNRTAVITAVTRVIRPDK